jgi:hypothetical protein
MAVIDFKAAQKWHKIPKSNQEKIINNAFCISCKLTTIVDYTIHDDKDGILIKGKCKKCGKEVVRMVEDE